MLPPVFWEGWVWLATVPTEEVGVMRTEVTARVLNVVALGVLSVLNVVVLSVLNEEFLTVMQDGVVKLEGVSVSPVVQPDVRVIRWNRGRMYRFSSDLESDCFLRRC